MTFLKSEVTRLFAIGFLAGSLIVAASTGPELWNEIVPQAIAATGR